MATAGSPTPVHRRYAAFISYRHTDADRKWAVWLHQALERYRLPGDVVSGDVASARLGRVFRDEEELPVSARLSDSIEEALVSSDQLIVVCSSNTPSSRWVNREVERFRELRGTDAIHAVWIEGELGAAMPPALAALIEDVDGGPTNTTRVIDARAAPRIEVLLALLSRLRGIAPARLQAADRRRRTRRTMAVGTVLLLAGLTAAGLAGFALVQRARAASATEQAVAREREAQDARRAEFAARERAERDAEAARQARIDEARAREEARIAAEQAETARASEATLREAAERSARAALASERAASSSRDAADKSATVAQLAHGQAADMRKQADQFADETQARLLRALLERARQESLDGELGRAAPLLAMAYAAGLDAPVLRFLLARAMRPLDARVALLDAGDAPLVAADLSADGTRALTATQSGQARVWDVKTASVHRAFSIDAELVDADLAPDGRSFLAASNQNVAVFEASGTRRTAFRAGGAHEFEMASKVTMPFWITSARFDPKGSRILTDLSDRSIQLWDPTSGKSLGRLPSQEGTLLDRSVVAFHPKDERIAAVQMGSAALRIWNPRADAIVATGKPEERPDGSLDALAFDPAGTLLAGGYKKGLVRVWDLRKGTVALQAKLPGYGSARAAKDIAFSPDGRAMLVVSGDERVHRYSLASRAWTWHSQRLDGLFVETLTWHASGHVLVRMHPGSVHLLDGNTGLRTMTMTPRASGLVSAGMGPDGQRLLTGTQDGTAQILDVTRASRGRAFGPVSGGLSALGFDASSGRLLLAGTKQPARWMSLADGREAAADATPVVRWFPDRTGRRALAVQSDGHARLWNADKPVGPAIPVKGWVRGATLADGRVYLQMGDTLRVVVLATGKIERTHGSASAPVLTLASRVPRIVVRTETGVDVLDGTGGVLARVTDGEVRSAQLSSDGTWLFLGHKDGRATVRPVGGAGATRTLALPLTRIRHVRFDEQGSRMLFIDAAGRAALIGLSTGEEQSAFQIADARVRAVSWSPDGHFVAIGAAKGQVFIHDAASGVLLMSLRGATDDVLHVQWSTDGTHLATADAKGRGGVWHVDLESRSVAVIRALVQDRVPLRLERGRLLPVPVQR